MTTQTHMQALRALGAPVDINDEEHYQSTHPDITTEVNRQIDEYQKELEKQYNNLIGHWNNQYKKDQRAPQELLNLVGKGVQTYHNVKAFTEWEGKLSSMWNEKLGGGLSEPLEHTRWVKGNPLILQQKPKTTADLEENLTNESKKLGVEAAENVSSPELKQLFKNGKDNIHILDYQNQKDTDELVQNLPYFMSVASEGLKVDVSGLYGLKPGSLLKVYSDAHTSLEERDFIEKKILNYYLYSNRDIVTGRTGRLNRRVLSELVNLYDLRRKTWMDAASAAEVQSSKLARAEELEIKLKNNPGYFIDYMNIYRAAGGNYQLIRQEAAQIIHDSAATGGLSRGVVEDTIYTQFQAHDGSMQTIAKYWPKESAKMLSGVTKYEKALVDAAQADRQAKLKSSALEIINEVKSQKEPFTVSQRNDIIRNFAIRNNITDLALIPDELKNLPYAGIESDADLAFEYEMRLARGGVLTERDLMALGDPFLKDKFRKKLAVRTQAGGGGANDTRQTFLTRNVDDYFRNSQGIVEKGAEYDATITNARNEYNRKYEEILAQTGSHVQAESAAQQHVIKGLAGQLKGQTDDWGVYKVYPIDETAITNVNKALAALSKDKDLFNSNKPWIGEEHALKAAAKYYNGESTVVPDYYYRFTAFKRLPNGKVLTPTSLMRHRLEAVGLLKDGDWVFPEELNLSIPQQLKLASGTPSSTYQVTQDSEGADLVWMLDTVADDAAKDSKLNYEYIRDRNGEIATLDKPLTEHTLGEVLDLINQGYDNFGMFGITNKGLRDIISESPVGFDTVFNKSTQDLLILARLRQKAQQNQQYSTINDQYRRLTTIQPEFEDQFLEIVGDLPPYLRLSNLLSAAAMALIDETLQ